MKSPALDSARKEAEEWKRQANVERDQRLRLEGKLKRYEEAEEEDRMKVRKYQDTQTRRMEEMAGEIQWLRRFIEILTVPKEKLEVMYQQNIQVAGEYRPRNLY